MTPEHRTVSRKTPQDGKLEVSPSTAAALVALGDEFPLDCLGARSRGRLVAMPCTCEKANANGAHVHYFVESDSLRTLVPETVVQVEIETEARSVRISR
jgi:hypothetical protein